VLGLVPLLLAVIGAVHLALASSSPSSPPTAPLVAVAALLAAAGVPCLPALRAGLVVAELLLVVLARMRVLVAAYTVLAVAAGARAGRPARHQGLGLRRRLRLHPARAAGGRPGRPRPAAPT
jgi:hypothetical protein